MRKFYIFAVICSMAFCSANLFAEEKFQDYISVESSASMEAMPDGIFMNFAISSENTEIVAAKKKNAETLKKISEALKTYGVADEDLKIKDVSIELKREKDAAEKQNQQTQRQVVSLNKYTGNDSKSYTPENSPKGKLSGYVVSNTFSVAVKNPENAEAIIAACINSGVNDLSGVTFCITEQKKFRDELRNKALLDAKAKAEKMAATLGRKLGPVIYIGNSESDENMKCFDGTAPWTVTIKESVQVKFELKY